MVETFVNQASFSVQQSVEKALKAMIVFAGERPPHTHDLAVLRAMLSDMLTWNVDAAWLARVTRWAVVSRYPTPEDGFVELDALTVSKAIIDARILLDEVRSRLGVESQRED